MDKKLAKIDILKCAYLGALNHNNRTESNSNITTSKYTWYFQVEFEGSKHARIKPSYNSTLYSSQVAHSQVKCDLEDSCVG
jgi:nucleoside-specific outer membrane channel protein Tsx